MTISSDALKAVPSSFRGDIVRPGDKAYAEANKRWSKLSERDAGLILYPRDEADVVTAVKFAVSQSIELVIKSERVIRRNSQGCRTLSAKYRSSERT